MASSANHSLLATRDFLPSEPELEIEPGALADIADRASGADEGIAGIVLRADHHGFDQRLSDSPVQVLDPAARWDLYRAAGLLIDRNLYLEHNRAALDLIVEAIGKAGYTPGRDIALAIDAAATEFYHDGAYPFDGKPQTSAEMAAIYADWLAGYPIVSVEDPLSEELIRGHLRGGEVEVYLEAGVLAYRPAGELEAGRKLA